MGSCCAVVETPRYGELYAISLLGGQCVSGLIKSHGQLIFKVGGGNRLEDEEKKKTKEK